MTELAITLPQLFGSTLSDTLVLYVSGSAEVGASYQSWTDFLGGEAIEITAQAQLLRLLRFYQTTKIIVMIDDSRADLVLTFELGSMARQLRPDVAVVVIDHSDRPISIGPPYADIAICRRPTSVFDFLAAIKSTRDWMPVEYRLDNCKKGIDDPVCELPEGFIVRNGPEQVGDWRSGWWFIPVAVFGLATWIMLVMAVFG